MICKIVGLNVDIPTTGGMALRCKEYISDDFEKIDIKILDSEYNLKNWPMLDENWAVYLESGFQFYRKLLHYGGIMVHASAVELDGKAYLFSGPSTVGKSTHTKLWQRIFGNSAQVFNDDKPALRKIEDRWYAYGTPWSGKDGINKNIKVPLAGICFLKQGEENAIRRVSNIEAISMIISQTHRRFKSTDGLDKMLDLVDQLVREIPIYELTNRPEPEAARLSYETMRRGAEEAGL